MRPSGYEGWGSQFRGAMVKTVNSGLQDFNNQFWPFLDFWVWFLSFDSISLMTKPAPAVNGIAQHSAKCTYKGWKLYVTPGGVWSRVPLGPTNTTCKPKVKADCPQKSMLFGENGHVKKRHAPPWEVDPPPSLTLATPFYPGFRPIAMPLVFFFSPKRTTKKSPKILKFSEALVSSRYWANIFHFGKF